MQDFRRCMANGVLWRPFSLLEIVQKHPRRAGAESFERFLGLAEVNTEPSRATVRGLPVFRASQSRECLQTIESVFARWCGSPSDLGL